MATNWRAVWSKVLHYGRWVVPPLISIGLVTWLIWNITPAKLAHVISSGIFPWLLLATLVQLIVLFLWDTFCLWWLFSQPDRHLSRRKVLRARADSVLWSAINLEIGQGVFAWRLAKLTGDSVKVAIGRCLLLTLFDFGTLQSLALVGSFLKPDPLIQTLRWICVGSVFGLLILVVILRFLPDRWRQWLEQKDWSGWLKWWDWRDSLMLVALRLIMFLLVLVYAGVCLMICRFPADVRTVVGVIPFVLLAESLPGTGGLGERETALVYLLHPAAGQEAVLLTFGLTWSTVIILGRVAIGLVSSLLPQAKEKEEASSSQSAAA